MPDRARSLVEAYVYLDLMTLGEPGEPVLTEERDAWRIRHGDVEVVVPYASEHEARQGDLTFGSGLSTLIDAGQWVLIATTYADRALEGALMYAADPAAAADAERFDSIATDWRFAADATAEALKLLPTSPPTSPSRPPADAAPTDAHPLSDTRSSEDAGSPSDARSPADAGASGSAPPSAGTSRHVADGPPGSDSTAAPPEEPPAEAFWTDMGRTAYHENPNRFAQATLADDLAYFRQSLTDFQRLHTQ